MFTVPTAFKRFANNLSAERHMIVKLTDGTSSWYVSDKDMSLSEGHVYPLLKPGSLGKEQIDIYSRRWLVSDMIITLQDCPYRKADDGSWFRISDEIGNVVDNDVEVYLVAGPSVSALSDCLKRFVGVATYIQYDEKTVRITTVDKARYENVTLPQNLMGDTFAGVPEATRSLYIPIVYGKFTHTADPDADVGLAIAIRKDNVDEATFVVADHVLHALSSSYCKLKALPQPSWLEDSIHSINDSGYGTILIQRPGAHTLDYEAITRLRPIDDHKGSYKTPYNSDEVINLGNALDGREGTKANILDAIDTGSGETDYAEMRAMFSWPDYSDGDDVDNDIGRILSPNFDIEFKAQDGNEVEWNPLTSLKPRWALISQTNGSDTLTAFAGCDLTKLASGTEQTVSIYWGGLRSSVAWHLRTGTDTNEGEDMWPLVAYLTGRTLWNAHEAAQYTQADGITKNRTLLDLYWLRLKMRHRIKAIHDGLIYADCEGLEFGSWIDGGSRSNSYNSGDLLEDPVFIIEDVLRRYLSYSNSDIDEASFDDAANASVEARINLHGGNRLNTDEIIRQIVEQSTFCFFNSGAGKAKAIALNNTSPTTSRVIPYSHIKSGKIKVTKTRTIISHLTIKSRYQEEHGKYAETDIVENTAVTGKEYTGEWPNICGTSKNHVANFLIKKHDGTPTNTDGIWAYPHTQIAFAGIGFTQADLEIGDTIELEADSVDPHVKCFGASWSGKKFLVVQVQPKNDETATKAIQLYT